MSDHRKRLTKPMSSLSLVKITSINDDIAALKKQLDRLAFAGTAVAGIILRDSSPSHFGKMLCKGGLA